MPKTIAGLLELVKLPKKQVIERESLPPPEQGSYGKLKATESEGPDGTLYYFESERVIFMYQNQNDEASALGKKGLIARFGEGSILRSRAGKQFNHHVYPEKGFAFSTDGREVRIVEAFPPCTLEEYKERIYEDPGLFIK